MDNSNCIFLVTELCKSCFLSSGSKDIPPPALKKLMKKVLCTVVTFRKGLQKEESLSNDPYQLIRIELLSRVLTKGCKNPDQRAQIDQCLMDLKELRDECNDDNFLSMLLLLYTLSKVNIIENSASLDGNINDHGMYLDSDRFNDINWDMFHKDSITHQTNFEFPFYESPGTGLRFLTDHCPSVDSFSYDFEDIRNGKTKLWSFDLNRIVVPIVQDEGFVTPGSDFSHETSVRSETGSTDESVLSLSDSDCNLQFLTLGKFTWEQLGRCTPSCEPLFASENQESFIHVWKIWNASRQIMMKSFPIGELITFDDLKTDITHLLFGVESNSFYFNVVTETFHLRDSLHLDAITPEMLVSFCEPVMECGKYYQSLKTFAKRRSKLPFGPVHQTFCQRLQQMLRVHCYCVLHINWDNIRCLSQLEMVVLPLKRKLSFLAKLCFINLGEESTGMKFPSGVQLLDYLYSNLSKIGRSDFRYILFLFFEGCCNTYLKLVAEWIFNGCFSNPDNYEEFFVEIQREHEICRDRRRVSCIRMNEKQVPKFLEKAHKDIFVCGKSVNLLKIFSPREALETILPHQYPAIHCCFNKTQIDDYTQSWKRFQEDCSNNFNSRVKLKDKLEKTYSAKFYEQIKTVRRKWFEQYTANLGLENDNPSLKSDNFGVNGHMESDSFNTRSESVTKADPLSNNINAVNIKNDLSLKSEITPFNKVNTLENPENCEAVSSTQGPYQTQNEEAEDERSDVSYNSTSQMNQSNDKNQPGKHQRTFYEVNESGDGSSMNSIGVIDDENDHFSAAMDHKLRTRLTVTLPAPIRDSSGNGRCSDKRISTLKEYELNKRKSVSSNYQNLLNSSFNQQMGDKKAILLTPRTINLYERNRLQCVSNDHKNLFNTSVDQQVHDKEVVFSSPISACAQNKLKVMSSVIQEGSSLTNVDRREIAHSTPMTACMRNRLRAMSSDIQEGYGPGSDTEEEKVTQSTSMTAREQNKLKVMSSEYHQRLCNSIEDVTPSAIPKSHGPNEYERNKLKIMSSEYCIRLGALADQNELIEEKLASKIGQAKLSERESDKRRMVATEYQSSLKTLLGDENRETASRHKILRESVNDNECISIDQEPESVSEDVETDEQITVIENLANELQSCESAPAIEKEVQSQKCWDVFDLDGYVSHSTVLRNPVIGNMDLLRSAANSVKDVDTVSILYYLPSSILVPLRIQSKLVNEAILRVFIEQENYLDHLIMLKNYLLLRRPEFSLLLTSTIFEMSEKVKKPFMLLNSYTLSSILQQALLASNSRKSIRFERKLLFVVEDLIPEAFALTDIRMLNCLALTYSVKWPINVLITEPITKKYACVFKFLMQLQRASWTLKSDFKSLKNLKRGKSMQYVQIQLYRHSMTQVIRVLLEFIMREALEKCWNDLVDHLISADINLDELYVSHLKYINKIMQRCFLCELSLSCHEAILNLLTSVLKYHEALRAGSWQHNVQVNFLYHTNFKNIHVVFEEFQKHLDTFRAQLKALVYRRQQRYFEPLLAELCNNTKNKTEL